MIPPTRGASGWMKSAAPAQIMRSCSATLVSISPVATGVSSAAASAACPSASCASSGSSIQVRSYASKIRPMRSAVARVHC